uniref:PRO2405 n=1 Tax=Homo sapiens TaxID=9606 RepID=Q9P1D5_HUMAN|nr:PRO2405 [Homo sapiens]
MFLSHLGRYAVCAISVEAECYGFYCGAFLVVRECQARFCSAQGCSGAERRENSVTPEEQPASCTDLQRDQTQFPRQPCCRDPG